MTTMIEYTLQYPIVRGSETVKNITVRKPIVGELRGLKLTEILQMDIAACEKLLPRITELVPSEIAQLDPYDLTALMEKVIGFFVLSESSPMT